MYDNPTGPHKGLLVCITNPGLPFDKYPYEHNWYPFEYASCISWGVATTLLYGAHALDDSAASQPPELPGLT